MLGRMSGPLCDRVLERKESTAELASIERSNLFLVPLDRHGEWYRYHHLFHDLLSRELTETEPELVPELHRRAADWYEENGDPESALEHADASGDKGRVARLVASLAPPVYYSGRIKTVEGWLDRFGDEAELERYPAVAVIGGWIHALQGQAADAERWLDIAMRGVDNVAPPDGSTSARPVDRALRAAMCGDGVEQMLKDAEGALAELPAGSPWRPRHSSSRAWRTCCWETTSKATRFSSRLPRPQDASARRTLKSSRSANARCSRRPVTTRRLPRSSRSRLMSSSKKATSTATRRAASSWPRRRDHSCVMVVGTRRAHA